MANGEQANTGSGHLTSDDVTRPNSEALVHNLATLRELRDVQGRDGTWNCDPYMQGMYNGMELAVATLEDRDPAYRGAPAKWLMVSQAERDVADERRRQVRQEGWSSAHDDEHRAGELAAAAACYTLNGAANLGVQPPCLNFDSEWPWDRSWFKPTTPRRDLVKAAALLLAEIERIDRAEIVESESSQ